MKNVSFSKQLSSNKDDNLSLNLSKLNDAGRECMPLLHSPIPRKELNVTGKIDSVVTNSELMTFKNIFNHSSHIGNVKEFKSEGAYSTIAKENYNTSTSNNRHLDSMSDYNNGMEIDINTESTNKKLT